MLGGGGSGFSDSALRTYRRAALSQKIIFHLPESLYMLQQLLDRTRLLDSLSVANNKKNQTTSTQ